MNLKEKLWAKGRPAGELPKDWIVIPVLDAIELIEVSQ